MKKNDTTTIKVSMPLLDIEEQVVINTHWEELADYFCKAYIKDKDLMVVQEIIKLQQEKIKKLEMELERKRSIK